jgi:hypothetical protein
MATKHHISALIGEKRRLTVDDFLFRRVGKYDIIITAAVIVYCIAFSRCTFTVAVN